MRTLEILLASLLIGRALLPLLHRGRAIEWLSLAGLGALGLHLWLEGYRWQMLPLYGISLGMGIFALWRLTRPGPAREARSLGAFLRIGGGLLLLGAAIIPPILLPIPQTPPPTGPYPVGTLSFLLIDETRPELYAATPGPRAIMVQIWYPAAETPDAARTPWLDSAEITAPAIARYLNLPPFFLDHVKHARSHATANAPIAGAQAQYPLLLFAHGWNGFRAQNSYQMEELASHGYIVAAADHTYGAVVSVFPDGQAAYNNPEALPVNRGLSDEAFLAAAQTLGLQWAGDFSFMLDTLAALPPNHPAGQLANRVDLSRVGALGHSTGGGAALQFCASDPRCKAVLGMDPYMDPVSHTAISQGSTAPYLALFSEVWAQDRSRNNALFEQFASHSGGEGRSYFIRYTAHFDFTDMPAFSPLAPYLGLKGPAEGAQVLQTVRAFSLAFFDEYLRGQTGALDAVTPAAETTRLR